MRSKRLTDTLSRLGKELGIVNVENEYVIFGSTSLIIRDILDREPGDIDVMVSRRVWGSLLAREDWKVKTPKAGDPPILVLDTPIVIHVFYDWSDRHVEMNPHEMIEQADEVDGWRVVKINEAIRVKVEAAKIINHSKKQMHLDDVAAARLWMHTGINRERTKELA